MDQQFRNAAFGGFHKQDVLNYLEKSAQRHSEEVKQLQEELARARAEVERLSALEEEHSAALRELREREESLGQTCDGLRRDLSQAQEEHSRAAAALRAAQAESSQALEETRKNLEAREAENARLRAENARLRPDAEAYRAVKERTAGIELDAHRRAQGVLDQAQDQAKTLKGQYEQWLQRARRDYEQLRREMDRALAQAGEQLGGAARGLEQISQKMREQDAQFEAVAQRYADTEAVRLPVAAPLPLPEE